MSRANGRKSILITGAASGMGRATALLFAAKGWFVGAFDVDGQGLHTLRDEIGAENGLFSHLDVTRAEDWSKAASDLSEATGGKLDLFFSNAGIAIEGQFTELAWDDLMRIVSVNLLGPMIGVRTTAPLLKATEGSLCLVNASSSSIWGTDGIAVYSATKHALRGLTEALSVELKRDGVRAADLLPGLVDTPMIGEAMRAMAPAEGMWRLVQPAEIAEAVWTAYASDQVHYYVPAELKDFDLFATSQPEAVRDERAKMTLFAGD